MVPLTGCPLGGSPSGADPHRVRLPQVSPSAPPPGGRPSLGDRVWVSPGWVVLRWALFEWIWPHIGCPPPRSPPPSCGHPSPSGICPRDGCRQLGDAWGGSGAAQGAQLSSTPRTALPGAPCPPPPHSPRIYCFINHCGMGLGSSHRAQIHPRGRSVSPPPPAAAGTLRGGRGTSATRGGPRPHVAQCCGGSNPGVCRGHGGGPSSNPR